MSSSRASAVAMAMAAVLLMLLVMAEGRRNVKGAGKNKGDGKNKHQLGMGDCGQNRTCREKSRECKKLLFASMVDDYAGAGDDEIVTTFETMTAMIQMLMEHKKNFTECANETGIEMSNFGGHGGDGWNGFQGGKRGGKGGNRKGKGKGVKRRPGRAIGGIGGNWLGTKWQDGNFGVSKEEASELRKCMLNKKEMLNSNDTLNRKILKDQISPAYSSQLGVQTSVEEAVDTCPEPQGYNIHDFMKCINKACIDNLELDDEDE